MRHLVLLAPSLLLAAFPGGADARVYMTQQQAIEMAFPAPQRVERRTLYLSEDQARRASEVAGVPVESRVVPYYVGTLGKKVTGYAYFDTHLVRTLPETILIRVSPEARIVAIDFLSFQEPEDYLPGVRWLGQFSGAALDDDLSLRGSIRALAGATLSARAVTRAARRVLALHGLYVAPAAHPTDGPQARAEDGP